MGGGNKIIFMFVCIASFEMAVTENEEGKFNVILKIVNVKNE